MSHVPVAVLPRLHASCGMQISRSLEPLLMHIGKKTIGIWKQNFIPRITGPAEFVSGCIEFVGRGKFIERRVPIHVDDQHVEWRVVCAKSLDQLVEFLIAVRPITRPPGTERESRRQRYLSCGFGEIVERASVIVAVTEEVPILPLSSRP